MNTDVVAIIVSYNSNLTRLAETLTVISQQCRVVVVDNSTSEDIIEALKNICFSMRISIIPLRGNYGIAYAQNKGIEWANENKASDILLMDDDSLPSKNLVSDLLAARSRYLDPVVVSALAIDEDGSEINAKNNKFNEEPCTELMSSGTLIPISIIEVVGNFDERLFIDCVDYEWGWRAISKGYSLYISRDALIRHCLGEGKQMRMRMPSPIRHYYQYRNVLEMIVSSKAPMRWRASQSVKLPLKLLLIALFADRRTERLKYAFKGIGDFLNSRFGKIQVL